MAAVTNKQQLLAALSAVDNEHSLFYSLLYPEMELDRLEYMSISDEEIEEAAGGIVYAKYEALIAENSNEREKKIAELKLQKNVALDNINELRNKTFENYDKTAANISDEAVRRGMGRSTFLLNALLEAETEKNAGLLDLSAKYSAIMLEYDAKITETTAEYNKKLSRLVIDRTAEIAERVWSMKLENRDRLAAAYKYNNELTQKEVAHKKDISDSIYKQITGDAVTNTEVLKEKLKIITDYFDSWNPADVITEVTDDPVYAKYVGQYGVNAIVFYYKQSL